MFVGPTIGASYKIHAASNSPIAKALTDAGVISWFDFSDQDSVFTGSDHQSISAAFDTDPVVNVMDKAGFQGKTVADHFADPSTELINYESGNWNQTNGSGLTFTSSSVGGTFNAFSQLRFSAPGISGWHLVEFTVTEAAGTNISFYGQAGATANDNWIHYRSNFDYFPGSSGGITYRFFAKLDGGFQWAFAATTTATFSNVSVKAVPGWSIGYEVNTRLPSWTADGSLLFDGVDDFVRIRDDNGSLTTDGFTLDSSQYDVFIVMETSDTNSPTTIAKGFGSESILTWANSAGEKTFRPYWVADADMPYHTGPGEPEPQMYINNVLRSNGAEVVSTINAKAGARFVAEMRSPIFKPASGDFVRMGASFGGKMQAVLFFPVLTSEQRTTVYDTLYQLYGVTP